MKLLHWLGFHNPLDCVLTGEEKFEYQSPFDLWITKFGQYKCTICRSTFWYPPGSFEEWRLSEFIFRLKIEASEQLKADGRIDDAIEVLKI